MTLMDLIFDILSYDKLLLGMKYYLYYILDMPLWLSGFLFFLFSISWPSLIIYILRCRIPHEKHKTNNEVGGFLYAVLGVAYSVILAFVVLVDYEHYHKAADIVFSEANAIGNLYKDINMFEEPFKSETSGALMNYVNLVVGSEWKEMKHGDRHDETNKSIAKLRVHIHNYSPNTEKEKLFYSTMLNDFRSVTELRLDRLIISSSSLPGILYFFIIAGYFITVSFTFFFSTLSIKVQLMMTSMLSMSFVMVVFLIIVMDLPFSGSNAVSPTPIEFAIKNIANVIKYINEDTMKTPVKN